MSNKELYIEALILFILPMAGLILIILFGA